MQKNVYTLLAICCLAVVIIACDSHESTSDARLFPIKEKSRWGYMDASGKVVVAPAFDYAWDFAEGRGRIKDKGRYGYVNIDGEVMIKPSFSYADDFKGGYARVNVTDTTVADVTFDGYSLNRGWTFVDPAGVVFDQTFASVESFKDGVSTVKDDPSYDATPRYVLAHDGKLILQERVATAVFAFNDGPLAPASDPETGKVGMVNLEEQWVVEASFDELAPYSEGLASARKSNQYGYIDEQGNWVYSQVVPVNEDFSPDCRPFSNGLAAVQVAENTYQYIDKTGKPAFKGRFKTVSNFTAEGYAIVSTAAGTGVIDKTGNWALKPNLDVQSVEKGIVLYRSGKGMGARALATQKDIVPAEYSSIEFVGSLLRLRNLGATAGYIDARGEFVVPPQFTTAWPFAKGRAIVEGKNELIYIDKTGHKLGTVPANESPYYYGDQYTYVATHDNKFSFLNQDGGKTVPNEYDFATDFEGKIARVNQGATFHEENYVYTGGKWGLIDKKGTNLVPATYELIMPYHKGTALVNIGGTATYSLCEGECEEMVYYTCEGGKWGLINEAGSVVIEAKYDRLIPFGDNFLAGQEGQYSLLNAAGEAVNEGSFSISLEEMEAGFIPAWYTTHFTTAWQNEKSGVLSTAGKWLVKPEYDGVVYKDQAAETPFTEGLVVVQSGDKWGAVDEAGTVAIPAEYEGLRNFAGGLAAVMSNGHWGFIDKANTNVIEPTYAAVRDFQGDVTIVQREEGAPEFVIDRKGATRVKADPSITYSYEGFIDGLCAITNGDAAGTSTVMNSHGKILISSALLNEVKVQRGGMFYAVQNDKWAIVNDQGVMITGFEYSWIESYTGQELIRCNKGGEMYYDEMTGEPNAYGGLWGMIDTKGAVRIPLKFADLESFSEGLAVARSSEDLDEVGYVDLTGKVVSAVKK
ncbi:WG repeat-containing protein [Fulvivirgaceae bacterium PWU5]|uniref:WG repeat-containing protein n=1 Tax=Dawidia cretensis TaxID=2782350 RepID=A0AAP2DYB7_9BACT|nr:WG repeat-containing protein [Dawidia cretensis]MBT1709465.1 WG repeat-containing protein [Dawidia cretensis]